MYVHTFVLRFSKPNNFNARQSARLVVRPPRAGRAVPSVHQSQIFSRLFRRQTLYTPARETTKIYSQAGRALTDRDRKSDQRDRQTVDVEAYV